MAVKTNQFHVESEMTSNKNDDNDDDDDDDDNNNDNNNNNNEQEEKRKGEIKIKEGNLWELKKGVWASGVSGI